MASTRRSPSRRRFLLAVLAVALLLAGLFGLWHFTELRALASVDGALDHLERIAAGPAGPVVVVGLYMVAGLTMFPITALIAATGAVLGPAVGTAVALAGCLVSALAGFAVGRVAGRRLVRRFAGRRVNRLSRAAARNGVFAVVALRLMPVAPFTAVNLAFGASHLRLAHYVVGTLLGMAPGVVAFGLFGDRVEQALRNPDPVTIGVALAVGTAVLGLSWLANRLVDLLARKREQSSGRMTAASAPPGR